jgi:hypothetical protein
LTCGRQASVATSKRIARLPPRQAWHRFDHGVVRLRPRPPGDLEAAVIMLDDTRAGFHPVTGIDIAHVKIVVHHDVVNVAADHALGVVTRRFGRQHVFKAADVIDRVLNVRFRPGENRQSLAETGSD